MLAVWILLVPIQWVAAVLVAGAVHEIGHLAAIWCFGGRIWKVTVHPMGARIETGPMDAGAELRCALAGPVAGSLLILFWRWIPRTALCALVQTVFNLLPVYPMDGGRAIRALGELREKEVAKATDSGYNRLNRDK